MAAGHSSLASRSTRASSSSRVRMGRLIPGNDIRLTHNHPVMGFAVSSRGALFQERPVELRPTKRTSRIIPLIVPFIAPLNDSTY
jgi:hypothetical protein